jgi:hypothetical protein
MTENARPQDVARPHRRTRGTPAPETEALLERYRAAMRAELADVLVEIRPPAPQTGQLRTDGTIAATRPTLAQRRELWDLAIKLGRELASSTSESAWAGALPDATPALEGRRDARAPRLTKRERAQLGAD